MNLTSVSHRWSVASAPLMITMLLGLVLPPQAHTDLEHTVSAGQTRTHWVRPVAFAYPLGHMFVAPQHDYAAGHRGIDFLAPAGTAVQAPEHGVVVFAGNVAGKPVVTVAVNDALKYSFEPLDTHLPVGQLVQQGEFLGTVGEGGHCGAVCLHFGVREHERYVNPLRFLGEKPVLLPVHG